MVRSCPICICCATSPSLIWTLSRSASLMPKPSRRLTYSCAIDAALGEAEPAHAMGEPRRAEPDLRDLETVADAGEHVLVADFEPVEFQLAMAAVLLRSHDRNAPHDAPARLIAVIEKRGEAAARIVRGARDDDEMRRFGGAGDEPFAAADHPFAVLLFGGGADHARIGAAARRRLGHGERRFHLALDHRPQPPLLLRRRADTREQQHLAVVGRRAVDRERAKHGARSFLVDRRPGDGRQRHAAEFLGRLRRPQSDFFGLLLHRREPRQRNIFMLGEIFFIRFEREHILLDKGARAHT